MKIAYFELGIVDYLEDYSISPKVYGGAPTFGRWAKELLNDSQNEFWIFGPERSFSNVKESERRDRCVIIKPASLEAIRAKQPITDHIPGIERFDIICHHHTYEWINKGRLNTPVVHWSGFGTGECGHPKNDYTLLYTPKAESRFGERFKRVKIGKPVSTTFQDSTKEPFIFQCTRHDYHMGSVEVAKQCLKNGIKGYFAGPISDGCDLKDFIDNQTTFYLGILDEESKIGWTKRATLTTYLHNWDTPFNLSVIESLAVGTPILANNRGFFQYILKDGVNGFFFDGSNFAQCFERAKSLSQKACWETAKEYSVEEMVGSFKKAFEEILNEWRIPQKNLVERSFSRSFTKPAIRWGLTRSFGVADAFLMTPVFRQTNAIVEVPRDCFCALDIASVLGSVAKIQLVQNPISQIDSLNRYGIGAHNVNQGFNGLHAAKNYLRLYGLSTTDCLPHAGTPKHELEWALQFLKSYRNPITFTPMPGGFKNPLDRTARGKFLPPEHWDRILAEMQRDHDILYFTSRDNYVPMPRCIPLVGFPVAKIAAVMQLTRKHLGVENGLLHLAIAMGSTVHAYVPSSGIYENHCFPAYMYTSDMFGGGPHRAFYHSFRSVGFEPRLTDHQVEVPSF